LTKQAVVDTILQMDITHIPADKLKEFASIMGKRGGDTTLRRFGKDFYAEIGKKGVLARKAKSKKMKEGDNR